MANYTVSGAGTSAANGTYVENGTWHGKAAYQLGATSYWITWAPIGFWCINTTPGTPGATTLYQNSNTGVTCPETTTQAWTVGMGVAPAPTVALAGGGGGGTPTGNMLMMF